MTAISRDRAAPSLYTITRMYDPRQIRDMLASERPYAAYALAQLEPRLFSLSEWYLCSGPGERALLVHSCSGLGQALFAIGDPLALDSVLRLHPGARFTFGSMRAEHKPVVERYFVMTRPQTMMRMSGTRERFVRAADQNGIAAEHLTSRHVSAMNRLYSAEGGPTAYRRVHVDEGVYYGVHMDGALVSIAGTHVVSESEGVAVVGNVFTHPRYRGLGLATIATSAVTAHLLELCPLVVLTVETQNEPAVAIYRRLGYQTECTLHETPLIRKEPIGVLSAMRRLAAGWRGRHEGKEIVIR